MAHLVKCLPHRRSIFSPQNQCKSLGMTIHVYNPSTGEVEAEGPGGCRPANLAGSVNSRFSRRLSQRIRWRPIEEDTGTPTSGIHVHTQKVEPVIYYDIS